jgi:ankyrin repeat protein
MLKASEEGHIRVVKELIKYNADIEAKDEDGRTPLFFGIFCLISKFLLISFFYV